MTKNSESVNSMKNNVLNPLHSETLAKRHQMCCDVDALAKRDKCRIDWIDGSAIQPPDAIRRFAFASMVILAGIAWLCIGAGLAGQF